MPTRPLNQCAEPTCNQLTPGHRCPEHSTAQARQYRANSSTIYNTKRWRILRRTVLAEQPICAEPNCQAIAVDVDHIVAIRNGGDPWARSNLHGLCRPHHSRKTAHEIGLGRR